MRLLDGVATSARNAVFAGGRALFGLAGFRVVRNRPMRDPVRLLEVKARELGAATILDIGANTGQFGQELLKNGWCGKLVSFEPVGSAHSHLQQHASAHAGRWIVPPPIALGSENGEAVINVSANVVSSSLLPVGEASTSVIAETAYVRTERVAVCKLDDVIDSSWPSPFAMKLDTQGFELEALKGATRTLERTRVIMVEMSLAPLYEGGAQFSELFRYICDAGFRCVALTEGFANYDHNEVLQVDGVFVRTSC